MKKSICLIFLLLALLVRAQGPGPAPMRIEENEWRDRTKGLDYTETFEKREKQEPAKRKSISFGDYKFLIYFLAVGLLIFFIIRIFGNYKPDQQVKAPEPGIDNLEEVEENLQEVDLDLLLKQALEAGNYRAALRLQFLRVIKMLSQRGKIEWAKEKTNWEYYSELKERLLADQFRLAIHSFEKYWYGEYQFGEEQYRSTHPVYEEMQRMLSR